MGCAKYQNYIHGCRDIDLALLKFLTFTLNHSLKIVNYVIQDDTDRQLVTDNH